MTTLPIEVRDLHLEIPAAPTLWLGRAGERGSIAIHFRWGTLTVRVSHIRADPYDDSGEIVFESAIDENPNVAGRAGDTCIGEARMKEALRDICRFL